MRERVKRTAVCFLVMVLIITGCVPFDGHLDADAETVESVYSDSAGFMDGNWEDGAILSVISQNTPCVSGNFEDMENQHEEMDIRKEAALGKTYYVDAEDGDDEADGLSPETAWRSIDKLNHTTFVPGDVILLKRGCVYPCIVLMPKGDGDENQQITISCYGDAGADLPSVISRYPDDSDELRDLIVPDKDATLYLKNQNYWTVENLKLTNSTAGSGEQSIVLITAPSEKRLKGVIVRNCVLTGSNPKNWDTQTRSGLDGINVAAYIDSLKIEGNEIYNVKGNGILINGQRSGVSYSAKTQEVKPDTLSAKGIEIRDNYLENIGKDGILTNNTYKPLVEYNVVNRSHSYAKNTHHVALWPFSTYHALFQYNEAYDTRTTYDGQGFDCDYQCAGTTFQYNYSHDNVGGFMLVCVEREFQWGNGGFAFNVGSTVRYNISQNDHKATFTLTGDIKKTRIYNNTIYVGRNTPVEKYFYPYTKGANTVTGLKYADEMLIANNIFYSDAGQMSGATKTLTATLKECSNITLKNNMFAGWNNDCGIKNGETTTQLNSQKPGVVLAADNISHDNSDNGGGTEDPLFVDPGRARAGGLEKAGRADAYRAYTLYKGSRALGAGIDIPAKEWECEYECEKDFGGTEIDHNAVNIGAYAGKGLDRPVHTYDSKYEKLLDFERDEVGQTGDGRTNVAMSGFERCFDATKGAVVVTDDEELLNPDGTINSSKCLVFTNTSAAAKEVSAKFYTYANEWKGANEAGGANGIRLWVDPNGTKTTYAVEFTAWNKTAVDGKTETEGTSKTYKKSFTVKEAGWQHIAFGGKFLITDQKNTQKTRAVTAGELRYISAIRIIANVAANTTVGVDDVQINTGEMDTEETYSFIYDEADTVLIEDFETAKLVEGNSTKYGSVAFAGAGVSGVREHGKSKAFFATTSTEGWDGVLGHRFKWTKTFQGLREELTGNTPWEGIQMQMDMVPRTGGSPLTEEEMGKLPGDWHKYEIVISSSYGIPFADAVSVDSPNTQYVPLASNGTIIGMKYDAKPDANGLLRIPFDGLYFTYKDESGAAKKKYLKDFSMEEIQKWKEGLKEMVFCITPKGLATPVGKAIGLTWYMADLALYKDVKHSGGELRTVRKPTCTGDGLRRRICSGCGASYDEEVIPATGHKYGEWTIKKEADKRNPGEKEHVCTVCGYKETEEIPATGVSVICPAKDTVPIEDFETAILIDSTDGSTEHGSADSAFADGVGIREHNGNQAFYATGVSGRNATGTHTLKWRHTFNSLTRELKKDGLWEGIQMQMDMVLEAQGVPLGETDLEKLPDDWQKYEISVISDYALSSDRIKEATVFGMDVHRKPDDTGLLRIPFDRLCVSYEENGAAKKVYLTDFEPEEVQKWKEQITGLQIQTNYYGAAVQKTVRTTWYMDDIALYKNVSHPDGEAGTIREASCTVKGLHGKTCEKCGDFYETESIPQTGHDFGEWSVKKEATESEPGERERICKVCGMKETEEIPKAEGKEPDVQTPETMPVGKTFTDGAFMCRVTKNDAMEKAVTIDGVSDKNRKKLTIPDSVTVDGVVYYVTAISAKAFYKNKKLTSVTIGKNIEKIGKQAFFGCTGLKTIKIKTTKLTDKSVGSKAFAKGYKKVKVTVPKTCKKAYIKLLKKRGISKTAKIK